MGILLRRRSGDGVDENASFCPMNHLKNLLRERGAGSGVEEIASQFCPMDYLESLLRKRGSGCGTDGGGGSGWLQRKSVSLMPEVLPGGYDQETVVPVVVLKVLVWLWY